MGGRTIYPLRCLLAYRADSSRQPRHSPTLPESRAQIQIADRTPCLARVGQLIALAKPSSPWAWAPRLNRTPELAPVDRQPAPAGQGRGMQAREQRAEAGGARAACPSLTCPLIH
eukprot:scaffold37433_cov33-Tisochrysis_lutea.AAC.1